MLSLKNAKSNPSTSNRMALFVRAGVLALGLSTLVLSGCQIKLVESDTKSSNSGGSGGGGGSGSGGGGSNTAPTISSVSNQTVLHSTATSALALTIGDAETAAGSLSLSGTSSNTSLIPNANIVFGGSGANRTVTITPADNQTGTATITLTVSDGSLSTQATFTVTVNGINLEVPIEMLVARPLGSSTSASTIFKRSYSSLDTAAYDGTVTYYFEVTAVNSDTVSRAVNLVDSTDTVKATITVPSGTTSITRIRSSAWTPVSGNNNYRVQLEQTGVSSDLQVTAARILVQQTNATKTKIYIPMVAGSSDTAYTTEGNFDYVDTSTSTTYEIPNDRYFILWKKNSSVFSTLATSNPWTFEAVMNTNNASYTSSVGLFNQTSGNMVTEVSTTSTTYTLVSASFADNATDFTDLNHFEARIKTSNASGSNRFAKAGLWVTLGKAYKGEVYYRIEKSGYSTTGVQDHKRALIDTSYFTSPTVFYEVTGYYTGAGSNLVAKLYDHGTNDSDTTGATEVSGSALTLTTTLSLQRSSALTITSGDRFLFYGSHSFVSGQVKRIMGANVVVQFNQ